MPCKDCWYWVDPKTYYGDDYVSAKECHRYPPTVVVTEESRIKRREWPLTWERDECGEFKSRYE